MKNGTRAGGERPRRSSGSNGDGGALRVRSEGERARADGREWQQGRRRARPSAPGGRPGRVQAIACSPRGSRVLRARHGGAAVRARTRRGRERGRGEGESAGGLGPASASGPEVRPRPASAPFSLFYFFKILFSSSF